MGKLSMIKDKLIIYSYYLAVAIILFAVIADMTEGALDQNIKNCFPLEESTGSVVEDIISNNDGKSFNTPTLGEACKVGNCYYFTAGNSEYVNLSKTFNTTITNDEFSVSFWAKLAVGGAFNPFALNDGVSDHYITVFRNDADDNNKIDYDNTAGASSITDNSVNAGIWAHYVLVMNSAGNINYFVNGISKGNSSLDGDYNIKLGSLGCSQYTGTCGAQYYTGWVDEVKVWTRAITPNEVSLDYNSGNGVSCQSLLSAPIPTMSISSTFPDNLNVSNSSLRFYFNGSVSNTRANNVNCTFRLNSTINQTKNLVTITNLLNFSISTIGWNKGYVANITCRNNNASASLKRTFWIYQPYVPPEEEPETNTTGSYAELIAVNNQIYEVLALIPFVLLWLGLWALGYHALQTNNTLLAGTMIVLTLPLDFFFSYRFQETLMLGTGFLGIAFAVMTAWTIGIFVLLKRPVRG